MTLGNKSCMYMDCEKCPLYGLRCATFTGMNTVMLPEELYEIFKQWCKDFDIEETDPIYKVIKKKLDKKVKYEKEN